MEQKLLHCKQLPSGQRSGSFVLGADLEGIYAGQPNEELDRLMAKEN